MTPEQFFNKNLKWFALAFFILFLFKSVQSCNRNMSLSITEKDYIHILDSMNNVIDVKDARYYKLEKEYNDAVNRLNFALEIEKEKAGAADKRASAVQSVAEKIRANTTTTVNVRGAEIDTASLK